MTIGMTSGIAVAIFGFIEDFMIWNRILYATAWLRPLRRDPLGHTASTIR
jgi:hypothetical protein